MGKDALDGERESSWYSMIGGAKAKYDLCKWYDSLVDALFHCGNLFFSPSVFLEALLHGWHLSSGLSGTWTVDELLWRLLLSNPLHCEHTTFF